jgi:hypothetical protein
MPGIGIRNLVSKGTDYAINFIEQFITSSTNIKNSIKQYDDNYDYDSTESIEEDRIQRKNMMIALIRDTYVCNLLLGYSGMMRLISEDDRFEEIDSKLLKYVEEFYNDSEFRSSLCKIYSRYREVYERLDVESYEHHQEELEYIRFLERIIDRLQIVDKRAAISSCTSMLENKIYNLLNVTPLIVLDAQHLSFTGGDKIEVTGRKTKKNGTQLVEIPLHYDSYTTLVNNITSLEVRHAVEQKYRSRTQSTLKEFADLVIYRKLFANEMGYPSFFQYKTRDKKDNSEVIKKLIISLNSKIDEQTRAELLNVYDYYNRKSSIPKKITHGDISRYSKIHSNNRTYDKYVVMFHLFKLVKKYFNIDLQRYDTDDNTEGNAKDKNVDNTDSEVDFNQFKSFELVSPNGKVFGRLYMDIDESESKKIIDPISIKVSDRMMISEDMYTTSEVVLLANYGEKINYTQVAQLFKEFGYVLQEICYRSGVGLVNRDPEFSNFMPLLMENIAWDRDTVQLICRDPDVVNHTIQMRYFTMCTSLKQKCISAKFDHLLHNSDEVIQLLVNIVDNKSNDSKTDEEVFIVVRNTIIELYQTIYHESFAGVADILDMPEDITMASIDPLTLVLEINGSQALLYSNLMNEIFAYACFHILKNQLKTSDEFRSIILEDGVTPFRDLISEFMNVPNLNSFNLYLTDLVGIAEEHKSGMSITPHTDQTDMTYHTEDNAYDYVNTDYDSTFNHFDDKPMDETAGDDDKGSIIRINKI